MSEICLASAGDDIKLWDGPGFALRRQFNPHSNNISCITWARDNSALASTSTDGDKIVLTYKDEGTHEFAEGSGSTSVAYSSASRYVLGGGKDGTIRVWDLKTRKLKRTYENHKGRVTSLCFNCNDTDIASGSDCGEIILHNVVSGMASKPLIVAQKTQAIQQIAFSHFKRSMLGAVSDDGAVNLWDVNKRTLIHSEVGCHKAPATGLAFSPLNEMLLLSCGLDKRIICLDVKANKQVQTIQTESPLTAIDMMNDGVTLAVGSTRGKIYIFDLRQGTTPVQSLAAHKSSVQGLTFQYSKKTESIGKAKSSRKPLSNVNGNTSSALTQENLNKPANHKHMSGLDGNTTNQVRPDIAPDITVSNQINNNTETGVGEMFSPIRDSPAKNSFEVSGGSPAQQRNSSLNKYADGVFSPLADENSSSSRSTNEGVSPFLRSRHIPEGNVQESVPSPMAKSQSHGSLMHQPKVQNRLSGPTLDDVKGSLMNTELSSSEPSLPHTAVSDRLPPPDHASPASIRHFVSTGVSLAVESRIKNEVPPEGACVAPEGACAVPAGATASNISSYDMVVLRNMVEDATEEFHDQIRQDVLNLHMEVIKLRVVQDDMKAILEQNSMIGDLMNEVERLREENKRLKAKF